MSNLSSMKMLFLFFTFLPLFSCSKSEVPDTDVLQPIPDIIINNVNKSVMLNLINNVRASGCTCGTTKMPAVPKLEWNDTLSKAAYLHSVDMKTNSYFYSKKKPGFSKKWISKKWIFENLDFQKMDFYKTWIFHEKKFYLKYSNIMDKNN